MDFPMLLLVLTVVTGLFWIGDLVYWKPKRILRSMEELENFDKQYGVNLDEAARDRRKVVEYQAKQRPVWLEWTAGLFPVILFVFIVRSFIWEPFRIPSGSMLPTLQAGDFIVVNKYQYGLRLPVSNTRITEGEAPKAGDVIVFKHPFDHSTDLIKRIVGTPGDKIVYKNKVLYINGVEQKQSNPRDFIDPELMLTLSERTEELGGHAHEIAVDHRMPDAVHPAGATTHPGRIHYNEEGFETEVPEGCYFVLGDNRDNSDDGRYWGFVPEDLIIGRAFFIWMNFSSPSRVGSFE